LHGLRRDDRLLGRARAGRGGQRPGKGGPAKEHGASSHHLVPHCGHSWFTTSSRLCLKTSTQSSSVTRRSPSGARVFSSRRSKRPARNMSRIWASESCTSRSARNLRPPSLIRGFTRVPLSDFFWLATHCRASFHRGCDRHASRSTRVLLSSVALPKVRPTSWTYRNGFLQSSLRASSLTTPSDRHMSFWFLALLSLCWRKTASSLRPSRCDREAPPARSSTRSSSGQAHPSSSLVSISLPSNLRWMLATSYFFSSTLRSELQNQGSIGHLRHSTWTG